MLFFFLLFSLIFNEEKKHILYRMVKDMDEKKLIKIVKKIVEPLSIETFLKLKGYKHNINKNLCNSAGVWENKEDQLAIVFYEMQQEGGE